MAEAKSKIAEGNEAASKGHTFGPDRREEGNPAGAKGRDRKRSVAADRNHSSR